MTDTATLEAPSDDALLKDAFIGELIKQIRAQDTHGTWEGKSDAQLLAPFKIGRAHV